MITEKLLDFVIELVEKSGYLGVAIGTFMETIFPPIPSEIILGLAGLLVKEGKFNFVGVIVAGVIGNTLSVSIIWFLGRKYGESFILRFEPFLGISKAEIEKSKEIFAKYGYWSVFGLQVVPLLRTLVAIPAGILKTTYWKFILANALGVTIWFSILTYLGMIFGSKYKEITAMIKPYENIMLGLVVLLIGYFVFTKVRVYLAKKK